MELSYLRKRRFSDRIFPSPQKRIESSDLPRASETLEARSARRMRKIAPRTRETGGAPATEDATSTCQPRLN